MVPLVLGNEEGGLTQSLEMVLKMEVDLQMSVRLKLSLLFWTGFYCVGVRRKVRRRVVTC